MFTAQLLPLGLGMLIRRAAPAGAAWLEPKLGRLANGLLVVLMVLVLIDIWKVVVDAGPRIALAIAVVTALALTVGHALVILEQGSAHGRVGHSAVLPATPGWPCWSRP